MTVESFQSTIVDVGVTTIALQWGGTGHPVLPPHGIPETHVMWHRVAPALAEDFTVVCADLRGYGLLPNRSAAARLGDGGAGTRTHE